MTDRVFDLANAQACKRSLDEVLSQLDKFGFSRSAVYVDMARGALDKEILNFREKIDSVSAC
jgi:hypothetical protein